MKLATRASALALAQAGTVAAALGDAELVEVTGWQRHSVLGALSRLRSRGFAMRLDAQPNRKAYRLDKVKR